MYKFISCDLNIELAVARLIIDLNDIFLRLILIFGKRVSLFFIATNTPHFDSYDTNY